MPRYIVREGTMPGEGRYFGYNPRGTSWTTQKSDAHRFADFLDAETWAAVEGGRVVRLVTLREELQRAEAERDALRAVVRKVAADLDGSDDSADWASAALLRQAIAALVEPSE